MLLSEKFNALIETHVAAIVSLGYIVTSTLFIKTDTISIIVWKQVNSGKGPSNRQAVCSRGRTQKWRSFVAQSFLFWFSAQEGHLAPSSEGGRGPEQLISVQASPWGMQERYHGDTCRREDPVWSWFLNGWGASADDHESRICGGTWFGANVKP